MILQRNPNAWSCLPTSFAMVIDEPVDWFIDAIGHDGSAEPYGIPGLKIGFHVQECIDAVWCLGYSCTPIEYAPTLIPYESGPVKEVNHTYFNDVRFRKYLETSIGVICGKVTGRKIAGHAVAWDGKQVFDSRGYTYLLGEHDFVPMCLWIVQ